MTRALTAQPGDSIPELKKNVTSLQLVRYAGASGDFNPIHTIPEIARSVGLDGTIAHGMLIMAFAGQMLTDWAGPGTVRKLKARFSGMTVPGESVICRGEITDVQADDKRRTITGRLTVKSADDDSLKLKGEFTIVVKTV